LGRPFISEINKLENTFSWASKVEVSRITSNLQSTWNLPLFIVGSGGSFSGAEFQATLHKSFFSSIAQAVTPLEIITHSPQNTDFSVWFHSASGRNIDIVRALQKMIIEEPRNVTALLGCKNSKASNIMKLFSNTNVFEFSLPAGKDGFLATNSLLGLSTLLLRAYLDCLGHKYIIPANIGELLESQVDGFTTLEVLREKIQDLWGRKFLHVVYSPLLKSTAIDIESKFTEAGICAVQLADLRNFAHGRHHWFAKNGADSAILFLSNSSDSTIASKTLALLPKDIPKHNLIFKDNSNLNLLCGIILSIHFTHWRSQVAGFDPGKPGVPDFGSKIYHLSAKNKIVKKLTSKNVAVRRKTQQFRGISRNISFGEKAYDDFLKKIIKQKFGAIVLDYDNTVVDKVGRFLPPTPTMFEEFNRLLGSGIKLGFATGRGKSIREALIVPNGINKEFWDDVILGYYNGSVIKRLSFTELIGNVRKVDNSLSHCKIALENEFKYLSDEISLELRSSQLTITCKTLPEGALWQLVQEVLIKPQFRDLKILRSSHSVDIVNLKTSKNLVVDYLRTLIPKDLEVLAIGDRGKWPGNDYELLSNSFSLSVDEVSMNYGSCWNLCAPGKKNTTGTLEYLKKITASSGVGKIKL
jgi:hydroxymethylpyrimidine pyrophosphatase-like HAD family hydrolase